MPEDPKLPESKKGSRRSARNEWLAADRRERNTTIAVAIFVAALLGFAVWLLILSGK